jgi:7-cyano-7-deazaguanine reductase
MNPLDGSPLGQRSAPVRAYDPGLLFRIERAPQRAAIGIGTPLPFRGADIWNAYELSWLDPGGCPRIALGEFRVPADSPCLFESKSLKLYLQSLADERMDDATLRERLRDDLGAAAGAPVDVRLIHPAAFAAQTLVELEGTSIDVPGVAIDDYGPPDPGHLRVAAGETSPGESLVTHLFRSNCPVTGQPDWASVQVRYAGPRIDRSALLRYLVSWRHHAGFHEHCVERIHHDIASRCMPEWLTVHARYTRRGGIDINPWRSTRDAEPPNPRSARQ